MCDHEVDGTSNLVILREDIVALLGREEGLQQQVKCGVEVVLICGPPVHIVKLMEFVVPPNHSILRYAC